jgi:hypothetical protein
MFGYGMNTYAYSQVNLEWLCSTMLLRYAGFPWNGPTSKNNTILRTTIFLLLLSD